MATFLGAVGLATAFTSCHHGFRETKDRLSLGRSKQLVELPMRLAGKGEIASACFALDGLAVGARDDKVLVADLLESFGVELTSLAFNTDPKDDGRADALRQAAIPYLRRAVPAYERAFGPMSPEVAVALHTLGDGLAGLAPFGSLPPEVNEALQRAYRIRLAILGPRNPETIAVKKDIASSQLWDSGLSSSAPTVSHP